MIKFFTNRELSHKLGIKLAKWKRWSREFLPPDPLGGLQSGYTRQYHPDQAFMVYLGGHLVANLKYTIPEARQVLKDLEDWLRNQGFLFDTTGNGGPKKGVEDLIERHIVYVISRNRQDNLFEFSYVIRGVISNEPDHYKGFEIMKELYVETKIGSSPETLSVMDTNIIKTLDISGVLINFIDCTGLDRIHYPAIWSSNSSMYSRGIGRILSTPAGNSTP